ncbi:MAG: zf-HC2 domain-containing protein [Bryobacteraceae bacterium]
MESNFDRQQDGHPTGSRLMAALDNELSPQQSSAVEVHVSKCPQCTAQWERLQQVSHRLAEFHRSISSVPEFELRLPSNEKQPSMVGGVVAFLRRPQFFMPAAALATAVIGLILWTNFRANVAHLAGALPPAVKEPVETGTIALSKPAPPAAPQTETAVIRPRHLRSAGPAQQADVQRHTPNPQSNAAPSETAEVFWYLPYSDPALAAEGAEVVRADLPREAFLMAGVPLANIPAAGPKDRIAADIVIGADGLPRAIRPARQQTTATVIPTRL